MRKKKLIFSFLMEQRISSDEIWTMKPTYEIW